MAGYLKAESPGVLQPPEDGWHDTGDIVTIDPEGYITIRGRAKRFAKVAGEMVSLAAVEQLVADLWPEDPVAVVALPDERKGERVVVVTTRQGATRAEVVAHLRRKQAADVMAPAEVVVLEKLPLLGSGKTDYVTLNKLARERPGLAA
jgi:acyl-[acyl-carrier-protein]-phospholipid O-acyltransferase/long-chain-fatty-acid--[acyl-carrier-protein] ligase